MNSSNSKTFKSPANILKTQHEIIYKNSNIPNRNLQMISTYLNNLS